jgi:AcrR family transcriptional regulator
VVEAHLLQAGVDLAREGGPDAVVLREATRQVGVAPSAAYRHFADRDALVSAVAAVASGRLAQTMLDRVDALPAMTPPERAATALGEVGRAYVDFAVSEPGLFHTAFGARVQPTLDGPGPHDVLADALDECVRTGVITSGKRVGADRFCWSAVHGFAELHVDGPLAGETRRARDEGLGVVLARIADALFDTRDDAPGTRRRT